MASASVLTFDVCQVTVTLFDWWKLPSHLKFSERDLQAALAGRLEDQQRLADDRQERAVLRRHHRRRG